MKRLILTAMIILMGISDAIALTIKQGEVVSKNQCLIYLVSVQNNRAYFQMTLPDMAVEKIVMTGGERRQFEVNDRTWFFDVISISGNRATIKLTGRE